MFVSDAHAQEETGRDDAIAGTGDVTLAELNVNHIQRCGQIRNVSHLTLPNNTQLIYYTSKIISGSWGVTLVVAFAFLLQILGRWQGPINDICQSVSTVRVASRVFPKKIILAVLLELYYSKIISAKKGTSNRD